MCLIVEAGTEQKRIRSFAGQVRDDPGDPSGLIAGEAHGFQNYIKMATDRKNSVRLDASSQVERGPNFHYVPTWVEFPLQSRWRIPRR